MSQLRDRQTETIDRISNQEDLLGLVVHLVETKG